MKAPLVPAARIERDLGLLADIIPVTGIAVENAQDSCQDGQLYELDHDLPPFLTLLKH